MVAGLSLLPNVGDGLRVVNDFLEEADLRAILFNQVLRWGSGSGISFNVITA